MEEFMRTAGLASMFLVKLTKPYLQIFHIFVEFCHCPPPSRSHQRCGDVRPHDTRESERRSLPLNSQWRKRKTHGSQLQPSKPKMRLASKMANQPSGELAPVGLARADLLAVRICAAVLALVLL